MPPVVRIDDEVWTWLKAQARPLEDTPNSVLRRIAKLEPSPRPSSAARSSRTHAKTSAGRSMLLKPFVERLRQACRDRGATALVWNGGGMRRTQNIVHIMHGAKSLSRLVYVKTRSEPGASNGFWGLRGNLLEAMHHSGLEWGVVLLLGPQEKGYYLSAKQVNGAIHSNKWSCSQAGDFKIHGNDEIQNAHVFETWDAIMPTLVQ